MGILEGFLNTQEQLGRIQHNELVNQDTLQKLELQKQAIADRNMARSKLAALNSEESALNVRPLSSLSEVPDAAAEGAGGRKFATPEPTKPSAQSVVESNLSTAKQYKEKARLIEDLDPKTAAEYRKEGERYETTAHNLLAEQRKEQKEKLSSFGNKLVAVSDQASLDAALVGADPEAVSKVFQNAPRGLDGRILATPDVLKFINAYGRQTLDAAKQLEIKVKEDELELKKKAEERQKLADEEAARHNKATEANAREATNIRKLALSKDVTVDEDGKVTPVAGGKEEVKRANAIRLEQNKKLKPLDEVQEKITKAKALLAESTPASDVQLQMALTDVFDKTRATNMLFKSNQNFGSVAGRISGLIGRAFTGQYTTEQRRQIGEMLNAMESGVIQPSRKSITDYYTTQAERQGVRKDLVEAPDFYGSKSSPAAPANAAAEAEAFLKNMGRKL